MPPKPSTKVPMALNPAALGTKGRPNSANSKPVVNKPTIKDPKGPATTGKKGKRSPNPRAASAVMFVENVEVVENTEVKEDKRSKTSILDDMVVAATASAAHRRAKLEAEAEEWLAEATRNRDKEQNHNASKGGEITSRSRGAERPDRTGVAVQSGIPLGTGEWSEAFSRKRAMNRMTEAVAAAAAEAAASISSSPGLRSINGAASPPSLSASMFGVRGSGYNSSAIVAAIRQQQQLRPGSGSTTKSSLRSDLIPLEERHLHSSYYAFINATNHPERDATNTAVVTLEVPDVEVVGSDHGSEVDSPRTPAKGSRPPRPLTPSRAILTAKEDITTPTSSNAHSPLTPTLSENAHASGRAPDAAVSRPGLSDIKSNLEPHKPVQVTLVGCQSHDLAPYVAYCHSCQTPVCAMCLALDHTSAENAIHTTKQRPGGGAGISPPTGHDTEPLADFINGLVANVKAVKDHNEAIAQQLSSLEAAHPGMLQGLHGYINEEIDGLLKELEDKRAGLHGEVNATRASLLQMLSEELATCEAGLGQLTEGRHVLELLMEGEGTSHTHMGDLIHGTLSYDAFLEEADPALTVPPRVTEQLLLQLPIQSLQDVCDLVTWTEASLNSLPQIFPK